MDFTVSTYKSLLRSLISQGYEFRTYAAYVSYSSDKVVILRHDVDKLPGNSLVFAEIEHEFGVKGTYYFRAGRCSYNELIIKKIHSLGHEVGYHYEDFDLAVKMLRAQGSGLREISEKELAEKAIDSFSDNLERLRKLVPVKTICMHGSPLSRYDNRLLWNYYNYRDYGIIGEPYFDTDFEKVLYLSDTGRKWSGSTVSIRDKVETKNSALQHSFTTTSSIVSAADNGSLPLQIMFTLHPQRWASNPFLWVRELIMQNLKNTIKWGLLKFRKYVGT